MDLQNFINQAGRYPVSTETFDFIQNQILLLQQLTALAADNIIIREPNGDTPGLCIINGELLPLTGETDNRIQILQTTEDITAGAETFRQARTLRVARYNDSQGVYRAGLHTLENIDAMRTRLSNEMLGLRRNAVPKGTIIDWCGTFNAASIPYGWLPCCRVHEHDGHWEDLYEAYAENFHIETSTPDGGGYFRFTQCNGVTIPNLTGRFTLGADPDTQNLHPGDIGGDYTHDLRLSETPRQSSDAISSPGNTTTLVTTTSYMPAAVDEFSIMPPYVALVKLIKII